MGVLRIATVGEELKKYYPRRNKEKLKDYIARLESYKKYFDYNINKGKFYFNPWRGKEVGRPYTFVNFIPEDKLDFELTVDPDITRPDWANKKSTEFHLPGHNYIGPGTNLEDKTKEPVDVDDDIAREHDEAYNSADTIEQVRQADKHAIHDFVSDFIDTGNYHSAIGAVGLGVKHLSGSKYGLKMEDKKRKASPDSISSTKKIIKTDPSDMAHVGSSVIVTGKPTAPIAE